MTYGPDDIEWRESEIAQVVEFLDATNPKGYDAERIKAHAVREWMKDGCRPTFIGTAGWYVTIVPKSYDVPPGGKQFIALVSVMGYSAVKGLETVQAGDAAELASGDFASSVVRGADMR